MSQELEEGLELQIDWEKLTKVGQTGSSVVPCAVQHAETQEVILVAYVNEKALAHSLDTGTATFWSTSRNELWIKGASSGHTFDLVEARVNCEQNSLLYVVRPRAGGICHTKNKAGEPRNCYYRRIVKETKALENLDP